MTKITILKKNGMIYAYQIKGHSGFETEGKDIVCSAVSTASQMTLLGLKEVLCLDVEFIENDGFLKVELSEKDFKNSKVQILLETMEKTLEDISKNYAKFVKMEVRNVD